MSPRTRRVLREALQLPPKARANVAGMLLRSLGAREEHGVDEGWATEVTRRIADVDSGRVKLVLLATNAAPPCGIPRCPDEALGLPTPPNEYSR